MSCVIIPKPNKDHGLVKGWRPNVLSNCIGKLGEKVAADKLQELTPLFHPLQFGSRKYRSAMDSMILTVSKVEQAMAEGDHATLLGKDIVSAFNNVRRKGVIEALNTCSAPRYLVNFVYSFLSPRSFDII